MRNLAALFDAMFRSNPVAVPLRARSAFGQRRLWPRLTPVPRRHGRRERERRLRHMARNKARAS